MVDTRKFSDFTDGGDLENNNTTVGLESGDNTRFNNPWTFLPEGSTGDRPAIAASMYYRLRFNTTEIAYEYYDPISMTWIEIEDAASVLPLLASHLPGEGASLIGLQNQSNVTNQTVQDLANASFIAQVSNGTLQNAQYTSLLPTGFVSVTTTTGVLNSRTIGGTANQIDVTNSDGAGNSVHSLSATLNFPGTFTVQSSTAIDEIIDDDTFATATATNIPTAESVKAYVDATGAGLVDSVTGTLNRIDVNNTDPANPIIDISASYVGQASITTLGTIATGVWQGTLVSPIYGGTGVNNGANTLTLAGNLSTVGAFTAAFTFTGNTAVTFPTSGTLLTSAGAVTSITGTANQITASAATGPVTLSIPNNPILPGTGGVTLPTGTTAQQAGILGTIRFNSQTAVFEGTVDGAVWSPFSMAAGTVVSVSGTANRITSTGGTTPVIDISASYVGQASITTLGTITTGVWTGTTIAIANGGTGITSFGTGVQTALGQNVTGSGGIVLATSPTITTPVIGQINDANGNELLTFTTNASAINFINIANQAIGASPSINFVGDDTNVNGIISTKGTGQLNINSANTTTPLLINSGTGLQHSTSFIFANTSASRNVTFPDAAGTLLMTGQAINTVPSIAFSSTSGVIGTTTNDSAAAGSVGELIESTVNAVAITSTITKDVTSISLTAGDWDVTGNMLTAPAAGTTTAQLLVGINTTSATFTANLYAVSGAGAASSALGLVAPTRRISIAGTTTVYLVGNVNYAVSTLTVGGNLRARRVR